MVCLVRPGPEIGRACLLKCIATCLRVTAVQKMPGSALLLMGCRIGVESPQTRRRRGEDLERIAGTTVCFCTTAHSPRLPLPLLKYYFF